jgi:hypothetical protein
MQTTRDNANFCFIRKQTLTYYLLYFFYYAFMLLRISLFYLSLVSSLPGSEAHQLDFEIQNGIRGDHSSGTSGSVADVSRDDDISLAAHLLLEG